MSRFLSSAFRNRNDDLVGITVFFNIHLAPLIQLDVTAVSRHSSYT